MKRYTSIIVIGSSGSGKTTLVNGLRIPEYVKKVVVPHRFITRPSRLGDDLGENSYIDRGVFKTRVEAGLIYPHWHRILENKRREEYGFETVAAQDSRLRIYSANNAFLRDINKSVADILKGGLVVMSLAGQDLRTRRLGERSPDMSVAERAVRLGDSGVDIGSTDIDHMIIDTTNLSPEEGQRKLRDIVDNIL